MSYRSTPLIERVLVNQPVGRASAPGVPRSHSSGRAIRQSPTGWPNPQLRGPDPLGSQKSFYWSPEWSPRMPLTAGASPQECGACVCCHGGGSLARPDPPLPRCHCRPPRGRGGRKANSLLWAEADWPVWEIHRKPEGQRKGLMVPRARTHLNETEASADRRGNSGSHAMGQHQNKTDPACDQCCEPGCGQAHLRNAAAGGRRVRDRLHRERARIGSCHTGCRRGCHLEINGIVNCLGLGVGDG